MYTYILLYMYATCISHNYMYLYSTCNTTIHVVLCVHVDTCTCTVLMLIRIIGGEVREREGGYLFSLFY